MKKYSFDISMEGRGWLLIEDGIKPEDIKSVIGQYGASFGGNKLYLSSVVVTDVVEEESW